MLAKPEFIASRLKKTGIYLKTYALPITPEKVAITVF
jgi:hypothetical protein